MHNTWHCGTVAPWHHGTWHSQRHASQASIFLALPLSIDALGHFRRSQKAAMAATAAKGELRQMRTHKDKAGHTSQCMLTHTHIYIYTYIHMYVVEILTRLAPTLTPTTRLSELLRLIGRAKDVQSCRWRGDGSGVKVGVPDPCSSPASLSPSCSSSTPFFLISFCRF